MGNLKDTTGGKSLEIVLSPAIKKPKSRVSPPTSPTSNQETLAKKLQEAEKRNKRSRPTWRRSVWPRIRGNSNKRKQQPRLKRKSNQSCAKPKKIEKSIWTTSKRRYPSTHPKLKRPSRLWRRLSRQLRKRRKRRWRKR